MNAHATSVGFTHVFGCQVVEDLKNKLSGFVRTFLLCVRNVIKRRMLKWCEILIKIEYEKDCLCCFFSIMFPW